jgi:hypothetical protein
MDYTFFVFIAALPLVIAVQVYLLVVKMSKPEQMMRPLANGLTGYEEQVILGHKDWLASLNFQYLTSFQFGTIRVAVFQQQDAPRCFSIYFHQKVSYNLETYFENLTCLDTSTSGSVGMFPPRPGNYKQSFPGAAADVAWRRHLEGEEYLIKKFGFKPEPLSQSYEERLVQVMRLHMQHVRSLPLWPLRALYWYAVSRGRIANKSIQQLYP